MRLACRIGGRALAAKRNAWPAVVFIPVAYADHVSGSCQSSGRVRAAMSTSGSRPGTGLLDRHGERAVLDGVLDQARGGSSAVLVVRGEPGIGKTVLLRSWIGQAGAAGLSERVARVPAGAMSGIRSGSLDVRQVTALGEPMSG